MDAPQYRRQRVSAGEAAVDLFVQGIEAHVHRVHARLPQRLSLFGKADAVGGESQRLYPRDRPDARRDLGKVFAQQRFAAGEAHLGNARFHERTHQYFDLLRRKLLPLGAARAAVKAVEIAPLGEAHPQVIHFPAEPVTHDIPSFRPFWIRALSVPPSSRGRWPCTYRTR